MLSIVFADGQRGIALAPWGLLSILAAADLLLSFRRRKQLSYSMATEIFIGESQTLKLQIPRMPAGLRAKLNWPKGLSGAAEISFTMQADDAGVAETACRGVRRGVWAFEHIWLCWTSQLKLFEFVPRLEFDLEIRVVPNIRLVQSGEIATTVQSALYGVKENRAIGEGAEFHQLRDFVQGMDVKSIDWKRSAKRRSLVARELRAERNHHVILALDTGYLMRQEIDGLPKIDHAMTSALAVAWAAAIGGDQVGYYAYDLRPRSFVAPTQGRQAFSRLRSWSGEQTYSGHETNHTLALTELNARTPKRSLIIVFTDFIDTTSAELLVENLAILAKRHLLLFVAIRDPEAGTLVETAPPDLDGVALLVAANQVINERRLVLERLARLGITVLDATPETVTGRLISTYLEIKAREMI
ncbi:DUF58 domain-containing protein [Pseudovibrio sp. Tun.PSC04-5.I4]|uniref:DUF58 domain-containing protein n=1 Tax=Pseudovibrio sp. Tun.PSC04-5.I4 TaxID=1798213 RepID=UPI00088FEA94|nr:DUF58 domain-containing protein [Pseudovibrio sp. Tun.PSC04-5.I4]SDR19467.1 Uncharacterized conserved protein, DUF58 family, contains vWF domain [Pseudovibrio sp. Tun.PSC04-5.I4]